MISKRSSIEKAKNHSLELLLPLYLVFAGYSYGKISLGYIFLAIWLLILIRQHKHSDAPTYLRCLFIYMILLDVIIRPMLIYFNNNSFSTTYLYNTGFSILYIIILWFSSIEIDEDFLYKVWRIIGIAAIIGLLYHSLLVYGLGRNVSPIRLLPVFDHNSVWYTHILNRPMSFFTEPASYVTYMLPLLYMSLKRNKIIFSAIITFTFLLSTSTNGLVLATVMWLIYLFLSKIKLSHKVLILVVMALLAVCFLTLPMFEYSRNKVLSSSNLADGSSAIRLELGFVLYNSMSFIQKVLGLQYSTLFSYLNANSIDLGSNYNSYIYGNSGQIFTNGISSFLIWYGILGTLLLLQVFVQLMKKSKSTAPFIIVMIVAMFAQGIFMNAHFLCYMAFILMMVQTDVKKGKGKL